jgi:phosphatidylserine/phosphatidylglycerophosphate/cardiolipin synthase-like enzyme
MVIDGETVITGSFNFTKAAKENNGENLLVIHDKKWAERYTKNWQDHDRHSAILQKTNTRRASMNVRTEPNAQNGGNSER